VISARLRGGGDVWLLGPVRGLASELRPLAEALATHPPTTVGLGASPEELRSLVEYFVVAPAEPVVSLTTAERSEIRGLVQFGEARVPNPAFVELLRWGHGYGVPVVPLDPSEDRTAALFTDHIGYVELVRRTVRERRASRSPPKAPTADEYALTWDRTVAGGRGSQGFARARDLHLVREARRLAGQTARLVVVVDRERFDRVRGLYESPDTERLLPG
jgi:hypothetical protein